MMAADRLSMLRTMGVSVALASDGEHLDVSGRAIVVKAVAPALQKHRAELIAELRTARGILNLPEQNGA